MAHGLKVQVGQVHRAATALQSAAYYRSSEFPRGGSTIMFPAPINEYVRPESVADALGALARYDEGEAIFLAGGQSAMQAIKSRMLQPQCVIDLQNVAELKGICADQNGVAIGAMTRYADIANAAEIPAALAALQDAALHVGDRQVRNRGTIGGSLCWNYVASCTPAVVLTLQGELELMNAAGNKRRVTAADFLLGPLDTAREPDEILLAVHWPAAPSNSGSAYKKWGLVRDALPVVGVCVQVSLDSNGVCASARIGLAGFSNGAEHAPAGEALLVGSKGDVAAIDAAMAAVADAVESHGDPSASAAYRTQLVRSLGREVALSAFERARAAAA